jgi:hypothetical protein
MKSLALSSFLLLATCRMEFEPPKAVPPPAWQPVSGEAGWRSKRIPIRGLEYKQRGLRQLVSAGLVL